MKVCLEKHTGPQAQGHRCRRAESLELRRSSTRTRVLLLFHLTRALYARAALQQEGVLGPCIHGKAVGRSAGWAIRGDDLRSIFHFTPPSHSRVAPHDWPKGGPVVSSNLGWPGGGLPVLDSLWWEATLDAGRSIHFKSLPAPETNGCGPRGQETQTRHHTPQKTHVAWRLTLCFRPELRSYLRGSSCKTHTKILGHLGLNI